MRMRDWSSDVFSSHLAIEPPDKPGDQRKYEDRHQDLQGQDRIDMRRDWRGQRAAREQDKADRPRRNQPILPEITENEADFDQLDDEEADRSEEHTSELQSLMRISYAVFCLKKK